MYCSQNCGITSHTEVCLTSVSLTVYEILVFDLGTVAILTYNVQRTCYICIITRIPVSDLHFIFNASF